MPPRFFLSQSEVPSLDRSSTMTICLGTSGTALATSTRIRPIVQISLYTGMTIDRTGAISSQSATSSLNSAAGFAGESASSAGSSAIGPRPCNYVVENNPRTVNQKPGGDQRKREQ